MRQARIRLARLRDDSFIFPTSKRKPSATPQLWILLRWMAWTLDMQRKTFEHYVLELDARTIYRSLRVGKATGLFCHLVSERIGSIYHVKVTEAEIKRLSERNMEDPTRWKAIRDRICKQVLESEHRPVMSLDLRGGA